MAEFQILADLGLIVVGATAALVLTRPFGFPPIIAFMIAGLVLGPGFGLLVHVESTEVFSHLGVALLLFVVGMELSVDKLRAIGRTAVFVGTVQVALMFGMGAGLARLMGFEAGAALVVGLVAAFSSTVVVVKLLERGGRLDHADGRLAVGILLVQDVLVAVALTVMGALGQEGAGGSVASGLAVAALGAVGLAVAGAVAGRWILPGVVRFMSATPEGLYVVALAWAFAFIVAAEAVHISIELGAFIAGVVLAQLPYCEELRRRAHPLVDFFLAVFFVTLAARIELSTLGAVWPEALAFTAFVLVVKPALVAVLLMGRGEPPRTAVLTGVTLGQISEFAFILAGLAGAAGLVGENFFGFVGLVGLATIGVSAWLVPRGDRVASVLARAGALPRSGIADAGCGATGEERAGHVIVVGMNTLGRMLVQEFVGRGERVLAVDTDEGKLEGLGVETLAGDAGSAAILESAGMHRARLVVSALQIEETNHLLAWRCVDAGVPVSIHAFDPAGVEDLLEIGVDHLMVSKVDGIALVEEELRRMGVTG